MSRDVFDALRAQHYNGTVTWLRRVHDDLLILRVRPDFGRLTFIPGQYTVLGLGVWEPHLECEEPAPTAGPSELLRRAYSICHNPVDDAGRLAPPGRHDELEFFITLVRKSTLNRPLLTPRLFCLKVGSRLHIGAHAHGHYTLEHVAPDDQVLFCATGTGEAPHNTMVAELLARSHRAPIASLACVRKQNDLAYQASHQTLMRQFSRYRYLPLTTREPENLDRAHPHYVGKRYIQDLVFGDSFPEETGLTLAPEKTHVFLCGNPDMIGLPPRPGEPYPPGGMIALLLERGFRIAHPHTPGNIHFERYF